MALYRVRRGDEILVEAEAHSLRVAADYMIDTLSHRGASVDEEAVLEIRVGKSWERRITVHRAAGG